MSFPMLSRLSVLLSTAVALTALSSIVNASDMQMVSQHRESHYHVSVLWREPPCSSTEDQIFDSDVISAPGNFDRFTSPLIFGSNLFSFGTESWANTTSTRVFMNAAFDGPVGACLNLPFSYEASFSYEIVFDVLYPFCVQPMGFQASCGFELFSGMRASGDGVAFMSLTGPFGDLFSVNLSNGSLNNNQLAQYNTYLPVGRYTYRVAASIPRQTSISQSSQACVAVYLGRPAPSNCINLPPLLTIVGPTSADVDEDITLTAVAATPSGVPIVSYSWLVNGSAFVNPTTQSVTSFISLQPGQYLVGCTVTDAVGRTASATHNVGVGTLYHYVDKQGNSPLPQPQLLEPQDLSASWQEFKVCADSSDASLFTLRHSETISNSNLVLRIAEDPQGLSPRLYGSMEAIYSYAPDSVGFRYHHPWVPPLTSQGFQTVTLQVWDDAQGKVMGERKLRIYRAPVLLVHGWTGDLSSMKGLTQSLVATGNWPEPLLLNFDYWNQSARSFFENRFVVPSHLSALLSQCRNAGYAAGKADAIGHSMGGILLRLYLQSSWNSASSQPYRKDMFRLITIDTPHSGSQGANFIREAYESIQGGCGIAMENIGLGMVALQRVLGPPNAYTGGAAQDLRINSPGVIQALNGSSLNREVIPTRAVVCFSTAGEYFDQLQAGDSWGWGLIRAAGAFAYDRHSVSMQAFVNGLFNNTPNDAMVSDVSQIGGLPRFGGAFTGQGHSSAPSNAQVIADIIGALNRDPASFRWVNTGYQPALLSYQSQCPPTEAVVHGSEPQSIRMLTGSVITSPASPASAVPGQQISVGLSGPSGTSSIFLAWGNSDVGDSLAWIDAPNGTYNLHVPATAAGLIRMLAIASGPAGDLGVDSLDVVVTPQYPLDSVMFQPDSNIWVYVGDQSTATLSGLYLDGVSRGLSTMPGVVWVIETTAIAQIDDRGTVTGMAAGSTLVHATYQGKTATATVHVLIAEPNQSAVPVEPRLPQPEHGLAASPNPSRGPTTIHFALPNRAEARFSAYDVAGRRIAHADLGIKEAGPQAFRWNGMDDRGVAVPVGIYFLKIQTTAREITGRVIVLR